MKRRFHDALAGIVGLAGVAFFALSGASCEAPKMQCAVGHGPFVLVYEVTSGDATCYQEANKAYGGACAQFDLDDRLADCDGLSKVEHVAFSTYLGVVGRTPTEQTYKDEDDNEYKYTIVTADGANYETRKIAVQSSTMGGLLQARDGVGNDAADKAYAFGDYTSFPDSSNLCFAGSASAALSVADMNIDEVVDGMDVSPAVHFTQEWSDLKFFVTTGVPGTQVVGNMKFSDVTAGCSVEYKFTGLYPAVFCGVPTKMGHIDAMGNAVEGHRDDDNDPSTPAENDKDDDKNPATPVTNDKNDDGRSKTAVDNDDADFSKPDVDKDTLIILDYEPDDSLCNPVADPTAGRVTGSGINPDFQTYCHPQYLHCVLKDGTALVK